MPDFKEFLLNPLSIRRNVRQATLENFDKHMTPDMTVYDVGCGANPFRNVMQGKVKAYIGVDMEDGFYDRSHIDIVGTAYDIPIGSGEADAVVSTQVLEHLERPWDALAETNRILRPGGLFFLSFPFLYPIHAEPRDFFRYSKYGIESLLKSHGFEIVDKKEIAGFWLFIGGMMGVYTGFLNRGLLKKLGLYRLMEAFLKWICYALHRLEGYIFRLAGKDPEKQREIWTSNYILVARKIRNLDSAGKKVAA